MKTMFPTIALSILLAGASSVASAGDWDNYYLKAGYANPQADSRDMTHRTLKGFTVEGGYIFHPTSWQGEVRAYFEYVKMGGDGGYQPWVSGYDAKGNQIDHLPYSTYANDPAMSSYTIKEQHFSYDMTGHVFGVDFCFPFEVQGQNFSVFTGPSLHTWHMVRLSPMRTEGDRSLKAGWRLGLDYHLSQHMDLSTTYTATEWRSSSDMPFEQGGNPSRPAYLSITATYKF
jgi:hypothetical protein